MFLYDSSVGGSVAGTVTDGSDPIVGATVVLDDTNLTATTAADGTYLIENVPDPVTYTVIASANGVDSSAIDRLTVDGVEAGVDFVLTAADADDGGGGPPPFQGWRKNDEGCPLRSARVR